MIIKLNKTIISLALIFVFLCTIACSYVANRNSVTVLSFAKTHDAVIIIDPGHGGEDGGAVAEDGTMEKNLNLDIALRLREVFELAGYTVYMTRESDKSLCDNAFNKNEDMKTRIELSRTYPDALFISIHLNKFSIEKYNGAQVFYSDNNDKSKHLAQSIQASIKTNLQPDNNRQIKIGNENSILLRLIESPAVIVEGGFLSNDQELALLQTEEYRSKLAYCIFLGVLDYQKETDVT